MQDDILMLLQAAKEGNEEALAAMIAQFMPIVHTLAMRNLDTAVEYDDLVQEGFIALFHAVHAYEQNHGASFSTYAYACVKNAMVSAVRNATRRKHAPLNTAVALSEIAQTANTHSPEELVVQNEQYQNALLDIETRLSLLERQVLDLFLDGKSYHVIAKSLDITEKSVENALQRVRLKLR